MLKSENRFTCDLKETDGTRACHVDFYYNPGGQGGLPIETPDNVRAALQKIVAITKPLSGYTTFYCCSEHAILAIEREQHNPPEAPRVSGATEADLSQAKRGMKVVDQMKQGAGR